MDHHQPCAVPSQLLSICYYLQPSEAITSFCCCRCCYRCYWLSAQSATGGRNDRTLITHSNHDDATHEQQQQTKARCRAGGDDPGRLPHFGGGQRPRRLRQGQSAEAVFEDRPRVHQGSGSGAIVDIPNLCFRWQCRHCRCEYYWIIGTSVTCHSFRGRCAFDGRRRSPGRR